MRFIVCLFFVFEVFFFFEVSSFLIVLPIQELMYFDL